MNNQPRRRSSFGRWAVVLAIVLACIALVAPASTPAASAASGITFVFDYSQNTPGVGFLDPVTGPARRAAVDAAGTLYHDLFASHFSNSATLNITIISSEDINEPLAYADSALVEAPGTFGGAQVLLTKLSSGTDLNGATADGTVFFNFNSAYNWELDPNASVDDGEISFYNAMLHEFTHGIGFASYTIGGPQDPFGQGGPGSGTQGSWAKWDQFLTDGTNDVVDHGSFEVNQTAFDNAVANNGYFAGPNAVAANGGPVHLSTQRSHLDDNLFPTAMMKSGSVFFPGPPVNTRVWNAVEVGILTDLGYTPVGPTNTPTPTNTPVTPTATKTPAPPTATKTATPTTATSTAVPPTATKTPAPPTATKTPAPPTATSTAAPPTATKTPAPTQTPTQPPTGSFPSTGVLDTFNRSDGSVGNNWTGATDKRFYKIADHKLDVQQGGPLIWKAATFGTSQEAYVTLSTIDSHSRSQGLLLKVQSGTMDAGGISVVYDAVSKAVRVSALRLNASSWTIYPSKSVTFAKGDVLGARALSNGKVEIYKNGTKIATVTLNAADQAFFNTKGGKIGIWSIGADSAQLDNFGGGTAQ